MIFRYETPDRAVSTLQKENGDITAEDVKNFQDFLLAIQHANEEHCIVESAYAALDDCDDEDDED